MDGNVIKLKDILMEVVNSEVVIYVDMDSVLTDFTQQFKNYSKGGLSFEEYSEKISKNQAWTVVHNGGKEYWSDMPWMVDGKELWDFVNKHFNDVQILSAPTNDPNSAYGKIEWCKRELHPQPSRVNLVPAKEKMIFSKQSHILVDDNSRNILQWREKGGIGILHENTKTTIKTLSELLELTEYSDTPFIGNMQNPIYRDEFNSTSFKDNV